MPSGSIQSPTPHYSEAALDLMRDVREHVMKMVPFTGSLDEYWANWGPVLKNRKAKTTNSKAVPATA